jgi:hypothetical protein
MSFQDVGMRGSKRQSVNATMQQQQQQQLLQQQQQSASATTTASSTPTPPSSLSAWGSLSIPASTAMTQISESLTQYQVRRWLEGKHFSSPSSILVFIFYDMFCSVLFCF